MVTTAVGRQAEKTVAKHLRQLGYEIIDMNWRAKACEIDIVAKKDRIVYFVEVKYRSGAQQGGGFDHITPAKQKRMAFAANMWTQFNDWAGDYRLLASAIDGESGQVEIVEV